MMTSSIFLSDRKSHRLKTLLSLFLFASLLVTGFSVYKDYGVSFDEPSQRILNGLVNYNYIAQGDYSTLVNGNEKYHGPAFEITLILAEKILNLTDTRQIYLLRHLLTFLSFALGVFFFYLICLRHFKNELIGITGCLFLVLSPRIFAESFYNSKDLAFMSFVIINIYTTLLFTERKTFTTVFFHALATAFVIDIRITGIIIPVLTFVLLIPDLFTKTKIKKATGILTGGAYMLLTIGFVILFWPVLWRDPVHHFANAFAEMSHYHWKGNVLYQGVFISAANVPWHYIPVWMLITTPLLYFAFFFSGIFVFIKDLFKEGFINMLRSKFMIINLSVFFIPLLAVIFLHSVVYDAWRHLYFIYPSFLLIGVIGLQKILILISAKPTVRIIVYGILFLSLINVSLAMIRLHPYQYVFFNGLAGKDMDDIKKKFELDYWGLSFKDGLNYVLDHDTATVVNIYPDNFSGQVNFDILPEERRKRIHFTDALEDADYFITNFRWHPEEFTTEKELYAVKAGNANILGVYRVTPLFISFYKKTSWHY